MAKPKHYLNNRDLLEEIRLSKEQGELTDKAVKMLVLLAERVVSRLPYADDYLREEAIAGAKMDLILYWDRFDETKSSNIFAYMTQIAKHGCAKMFNKCYKYGKKFKGTLISMDGNRQNDSDRGIYSI
jgi:hypothetical protein